ncbi:hypothetical protein M8C21_022573, partial [Ambrosia artemisiifolia]
TRMGDSPRVGSKYLVVVRQVLKAQHSTQGIGGAIIQVELRDVDSGNKVNERIPADETVEKIFVEAKSYTYLYTDEETETVVLMEPNTFAQLDFSHLAWVQTERKSGGLGFFIIDKEGVIQYSIVNNLAIGGSVDESLRTLQALQYVQENPHEVYAQLDGSQGESR